MLKYFVPSNVLGLILKPSRLHLESENLPKTTKILKVMRFPGAKWHRRRKILTPTFHFDILKSFMPVFEEHSRNIVKHLKRTVQEGSDVIDVMPVISDFTLYIICGKIYLSCIITILVLIC